VGINRVFSGWVQEAATLLGKAAKVKLTVAGGKVTVAGPTNKAVVVIPDVKAGKSIVHVIDTVVGSTACCCSVREQVAPALLDVGARRCPPSIYLCRFHVARVSLDCWADSHGRKAACWVHVAGILQSASTLP
jgi:hypothetical protein